MRLKYRLPYYNQNCYWINREGIPCYNFYKERLSEGTKNGFLFGLNFIYWYGPIFRFIKNNPKGIKILL